MKRECSEISSKSYKRETYLVKRISYFVRRGCRRLFGALRSTSHVSRFPLLRFTLYPSRFTNCGFTLIEMIGVLAVIAVLVALLLPRVFEIMAESKANALVAAVKTYQTAIVDYYSDIGSILPLNVAGVPTAENSGNSNNARSLPSRLTLDQSDPLNTGANSWVKFRGPYLDKFVSTTPPGLGTVVRMPARAPQAYGTATTGGNRAWDFTGDGNSDIPTAANVVYVAFSDISLQDFERVDAILDKGFGSSAVERQLRGRVKYDTSTNEMLIYLMHG